MTLLASAPTEMQSYIFFHTHLDVPEGQQQVNDNIRGEQLHAVQAFLDAPQFHAQVLAAETLPCHANLLPDGLPEVLATVDNTTLSYPA